METGGYTEIPISADTEGSCSGLLIGTVPMVAFADWCASETVADSSAHSVESVAGIFPMLRMRLEVSSILVVRCNILSQLFFTGRSKEANHIFANGCVFCGSPYTQDD